MRRDAQCRSNYGFVSPRFLMRVEQTESRTAISKKCGKLQALRYTSDNRNYVRKERHSRLIRSTFGSVQFETSGTFRPALFWDVTQRRVVILYRHFGTTYRSHLQGSRRVWNLKPEGWRAPLFQGEKYQRKGPEIRKDNDDDNKS
jgi:hypothetical protein